MHKSKKKSSAKTVKIPKPIKIKKEKTEEDRLPHPMSHYMDDRLELVKQIFGTLKPKTITNLAPDFLKKKTLEEIEELCLNELLGISTKRLKAIINGAKCPTDTESSEDSDVHNIEEHVSLEEISSDSEIEGNSSKATKNKVSKSTGGTKKGSKNGAEKNETGGQISVLELLELQARARAIRSQLALEPVTKIEVDSDGGADAADVDKKSNDKTKETHSNNRKERKRKSSEMIALSKTKKDNSNRATTSTASATQSNGTTEKHKETNGSSTSAEPTKKIKLKRNFRMNKQNDESETKSEIIQKPSEKNDTEIKEEKHSRSPSPDVIPIVAETETLLITDSSSEDEEENIISKTTKVMEHVGSEKNKIEEHEQENELETGSSVNRERKITEPEDGEISEDSNIPENKKDKEKSEEISEKNVKNTDDSADNTLNPINSCSEENHDKQNIVETLENIDSQTEKSKEQKEFSKVSVGKEIVEDNNKTTESELKDKESSEIVDTAQKEIEQQADDEDDDQNDDVISIEGGDLESEMIEHLGDKSPVAKMSSFQEKDDEKVKSKPEVEEDIISLDSSEDELRNKKDLESWNTRWLKSSKVSKVLAASKLGKRVRDKIKKSKRSKKNSTREDQEDEEVKKANSSYTSKHEDGSIEQYKELLDIRQRKT